MKVEPCAVAHRLYENTNQPRGIQKLMETASTESCSLSLEGCILVHQGWGIVFCQNPVYKNAALLGKQLWCFFLDSLAVWQQIGNKFWLYQMHVLCYQYMLRHLVLKTSYDHVSCICLQEHCWVGPNSLNFLFATIFINSLLLEIRNQLLG